MRQDNRMRWWAELLALLSLLGSIPILVHVCSPIIIDPLPKQPMTDYGPNGGHLLNDVVRPLSQDFDLFVHLAKSPVKRTVLEGQSLLKHLTKKPDPISLVFIPQRDLLLQHPPHNADERQNKGEYATSNRVGPLFHITSAS